MNDCKAAIGTPEQAARLQEVIKESRSTPGCLMHILQEAQAIYGYLPLPVQQTIAQGLNVSLSEVYGVATFYSQFSLKPKGKYRVSVCLGTACYVKGSGEILEKINATGVGPQGLGGDVTSLAVHIDFHPCHIASMPVALNLNCHAARHAEVTL